MFAMSASSEVLRRDETKLMEFTFPTIGNMQYWADGISVACADSHVHGNWVHGATDGGIVLFGAPGTLVENNTVWVGDNTQLGGIVRLFFCINTGCQFSYCEHTRQLTQNMVDINPWGGNYTGTVVRNNTIMGGFATTVDGDGDSKGDNNETAIMK